MTVPVSALANGTVKVLDGGSVTTTKVTVGLVGGAWVQVTRISDGATVVLADANADLPSNSSTRGLTNNGFPGGGPPNGGAPPGGAGGNRG